MSSLPFPSSQYPLAWPDRPSSAYPPAASNTAYFPFPSATPSSSRPAAAALTRPALLSDGGGRIQPLYAPLPPPRLHTSPAPAFLAEVLQPAFRCSQPRSSTSSGCDESRVWELITAAIQQSEAVRAQADKEREEAVGQWAKKLREEWSERVTDLSDKLQLASETTAELKKRLAEAEKSVTELSKRIDKMEQEKRDSAPALNNGSSSSSSSETTHSQPAARASQSQPFCAPSQPATASPLSQRLTGDLRHAQQLQEEEEKLVRQKEKDREKAAQLAQQEDNGHKLAVLVQQRDDAEHKLTAAASQASDQPNGDDGADEEQEEEEEEEAAAMDETGEEKEPDETEADKVAEMEQSAESTRRSTTAVWSAPLPPPPSADLPWSASQPSPAARYSRRPVVAAAAEAERTAGHLEQLPALSPDLPSSQRASPPSLSPSLSLSSSMTSASGAVRKKARRRSETDRLREAAGLTLAGMGSAGTLEFPTGG